MGFQQGLSGLNVSSKNLEVIGNNVANANTYGAKTARAEFADMYAASLGGSGSNGVGIGARVATVAQQFTQGNISTTANSLDVAINGRGFFGLLTPEGQYVYSRNGQFKRDSEGYLVNNERHQLLGRMLDDNGNVVSSQTPIRLTNDTSPPQPAERITLALNLKADATVKTGAVDLDVASTYDFVTSQSVYGDNGVPITVNYYFRKETAAVAANPSAVPPVAAAGGQWGVYMSANGAPLPSDPPARVGTLSFSASGIPTGTTTLTLHDIPGGANGQPLTGVELDLAGATEYAGNFSVRELSGGGYAEGNLSDFVIETDGTVKARYTNGQSKAIAQMELTDFRNLNGLQPIGGNEWKPTQAAGAKVDGVPGSGVFGLLQAGALEESNVDLTGELVSMIVAQRAYQANAQTIKTEDQVLQTLVNLK
nr:flagellar hook protein FlgE [uncultured Aquabacterium sp.]